MVVLTTQTASLDAVWSAWSFRRFFCEHEFDIIVACDGEPPASLVRLCERVLPGSRVVDAWLVAREEAGSIRQFVGGHYLGLKLALILASQRDAATLYFDSDVVCMNHPEELVASIRDQPNLPLYMQGDAECLDPWVLREAKTQGFGFDARLNSGLLWCPRRCLDAGIATELLVNWQPPVQSHFTEQNIIGVLMHAASAHGLPKERYIANAQRMFYFEKDVDYNGIACRHFVGLIRNLMYSKGLPHLWQQARMQGAQTARPSEHVGVGN